MTSTMAGKVALITGGSSGIGRSASLLFAREGAQVVVAARRTDAGEETVHMIREAGGDACFVRTDVSQASAVHALVTTCVRSGMAAWTMRSTMLGSRAELRPPD